MNWHGYKKARWVCAAAWAVMATSASAQSSTEPVKEGVSDEQPESKALGEIVVTAQRSSQTLSRVPLSIQAYSQEKLDRQGVRQVDDVTRLTPGVQFDRSGYGLTTNIAIRGISSGAGSSTTGIYIDDTPIQVRSIGNSSGNAYPVIFDLERVEVLRGPQGTLFGAGSQGGTVRFITPDPNLSGMDVYSRAELAFTKAGAPSYELGAALGAPLQEGKVGARVSAFYRRDGGFVDRVPYPDGDGANPSRGFPKKDSNSVDTFAGRVALGVALTDTLTVTPSIFYQNLESNDTNQYWVSVAGRPISDRDNQDYINGSKIASSNRDQFLLPALKVRWDLGPMTLASDTSFFRRRESGIYDYGAFINNIFGFGSDPTPTLSIPGNYDVGRLSNAQDNWTQEFRISSNDPGARLTYVLGVFWTRAKQRSHQDIANPFFESIVGTSVSSFYGGFDRTSEGYIYVDDFWTVDKQLAGFGEVNFEALKGLKLTAGLRIAKTELDFRTTRDGPAQAGPGGDSGRQTEKPVTPKFGISYQIDPSNLVYATAAKGFRIGGVNRNVPTNATCGTDLAAIGLTQAPRTYDSDTVWSYEIGSKNRIGNSVRVAASAYHIKWKNIIQPVDLPNCGFAFTSNLGSATIKGFDLQVDVEPVRNLTFGLALGYNHGTFDETIASGGPKNLVTKGYAVGGAPWVVTVSGQYDFSVARLEGYLRFDYNYRSRDNGLTNTFDPKSADFDPLIPRDPGMTDLRLRAGFRTEGLDLSAFVNNATNEKYLMGVGHTTRYGQVFTAVPVRPITFGLTAAYRY